MQPIPATESLTENDEPEPMYAHKVHTYTRYYGEWVHHEEVMFFTVDEILDPESKIFKINPTVLREIEPSTGEEWRDSLEAMTPSNRDPHFPSVSYNGGMHIISEDEYHQALDTVRRHDERINNVIDLPGILTTADAEQDRYHIYLATEKAKNLIRSYEGKRGV